jgi:uncharacterized membrane protein
MLYNSLTSYYVIITILAAIFYYLLSRYYLNSNNLVNKEEAVSKSNFFANILIKKSGVYLYLLVPIIYILVQYVFKKSKK